MIFISLFFQDLKMVDTSSAYHCVINNQHYQNNSEIFDEIIEYIQEFDIINYGKLVIPSSSISSTSDFFKDLFRELRISSNLYDIILLNSNYLLLSYENLYFLISWRIDGDNYIFPIIHGTNYAIDENDEIFVFYNEDDDNTVVGIGDYHDIINDDDFEDDDFEGDDFDY